LGRLCKKQKTRLLLRRVFEYINYRYIISTSPESKHENDDVIVD